MKTHKTQIQAAWQNIIHNKYMQDIPVLLRKLTTKGPSRLLTSDVVDLVVLEGPVDLLHVGEHHLGVEPP